MFPYFETKNYIADTSALCAFVSAFFITQKKTKTLPIRREPTYENEMIFLCWLFISICKKKKV